jgi:preprotein translocase subunit SecA
VPIESKMVTRQIKSAQTQIEAQNAEIRKNVLKYDEVLNKQRQVIYAERKRVLDGEDLSDQIRHMIDDVVGAYVVGATATGETSEDWDLDQLWASLKQLYPVGQTIEDLEEEAGGSLDPEFLRVQLIEDAHEAYDRREEELGVEAVRELERQVLLNVIDRKWREHLYEMDYLQEGITLRAYAQRDPVVEYQREGFDMFQQMQEGIKEEAVGFLFNLEVQVEEAPAAEADDEVDSDVGTSVPLPETHVEIRAKGLGGNRMPRALQYSAPTIDGEAGVVIEQEQAPALGIGIGTGGTNGANGSSTGQRPSPSAARRAGPPSPTSGTRKPSPGQAVASNGPSRNAPCPCGSGKKYKRCHGAPGGA